MFIEWLKLNEHIWLFWQLNTEIIIGSLTLLILVKEYYYDFEKDEAKRQRKTKTSKKTTTQPGGATITEETSEIIVPIEETDSNDMSNHK